MPVEPNILKWILIIRNRKETTNHIKSEYQEYYKSKSEHCDATGVRTCKLPYHRTGR